MELIIMTTWEEQRLDTLDFCLDGSMPLVFVN